MASSATRATSDLEMGSRVTQTQRRGEKVLKRYNLAQKVVGIAMIILFALTAVFVCLTLFDKIHPLVSVGTLGGSILCWIVMQVVDSCRTKSAEKHCINLKDFDNVGRNNKSNGSDSESGSDSDNEN